LQGYTGTTPLGREFKALKRIEAQLAKQRRLDTLKRGTQLPDGAKLPQRDLGKARDKSRRGS